MPMMTLDFNLILAAWLFSSAFILDHTTASAWNAVVVALLVAANASAAFSRPSRPGLRWGIAVLATWLLAATMIVPHLAMASLVNEVAVAVLLALGTFRPPARTERTAHSTSA
jgi:hypothetical protein